MKNTTQPLLALACGILHFGLVGCDSTTMKSSEIEAREFGKLPDGSVATLYILKNQHGMEARITDFGATLVSLWTPDSNGQSADITLGFDHPTDYLAGHNPYFGATVGRFGNRIAHGKFSLDGKEHTLATNNEPGGMPCHLHGGIRGFNRVLWHAEPRPSENSVTFTYVSQDGEEGYPGTLTARVTYILNDDRELIWHAEATTDAPTVVNLVHHTYWNLSGDPANSINNHILTLDADHYLPTNPGLIPTGEKAPVSGTPMDFTEGTSIGARVETDFEALRLGGGYDHCWVLREGDGLRRAARVHDPKSGRVMEIFTDQPGIQFYGGNFLDGKVAGKGGVRYPHRSGLCLETENFPDAPNQAHFPSAILRPGETYRHTMIHRFSDE